ncbi:MAG TPA: hypothetical protein VKM55_23670 [Candidatus Lokiarchaeia archaeon]|nr:hypothetical protein [Candidatus Lokiarchaeia archaeon]
MQKKQVILETEGGMAIRITVLIPRTTQTMAISRSRAGAWQLQDSAGAIYVIIYAIRGPDKLKLRYEDIEGFDDEEDVDFDSKPWRSIV